MDWKDPEQVRAYKTWMVLQKNKEKVDAYKTCVLQKNKEKKILPEE